MGLLWSALVQDELSTWIEIGHSMLAVYVCMCMCIYICVYMVEAEGDAIKCHEQVQQGLGLGPKRETRGRGQV